MGAFASINGEEDGFLEEIVAIFVLNDDLINGIGSPRHQVMVALRRIGVPETHKEVSVALVGDQLYFKAF